jgi:hypothetical protein
MHVSPPSLAIVGRQPAYVLLPRVISQHKGFALSVQSLVFEHSWMVSVAAHEYLSD